MANDTRADALNLGFIRLEPTVTNDRIGFREGGKPERNDFYKFTLEEESDFNLTLDGLDANANVQILDSDGSVAFQSKKSGKRAEVIDAELEAGEYFVRVLPKGGAQTDYRLSLSADPIGSPNDDILPGIPKGILDKLTEELVVNDEIGFTRGGQRDEDDYFNFSLDEDSDVSLTLDQLKANANVQIWDGEGETLLLQSRNTGRQGETINAILEKGNYVVRVLPQGAAKTSYRLALNADEVLPPDQLPGSNAGDLMNPVEREPVFAINDIGFGRGRQRDQKDYYTFNLSQSASFYGELDLLQRDANIYLYDYDPSKKGKNSISLLSKSTVKGKRADTINEFLEEGDYAVEVRPKGAAKTGYRLELDAQVDVDDFPTLGTAKPLGELEQKPTNEKNNVGVVKGERFKDQEDWFQFTLSDEKNVDLTLDELRVNAADAEIYNSSGKLLYRSKNKGRDRETINETFESGTYYVRVVARGNGNTDYRLSLSAEKGIPPEDPFPLGTLASPTEYDNVDTIGEERSGVRNERDEYTFTLSESTDFRATLDQIQQNANLELYKGRNLVASSRESGRTGELIGEVLEPGNYSLRVIPVGNAETSYRLGIETETADGGDEFFPDDVGSLISLKDNEYTNKEDIGFTERGVRNGNDFYNFSLDSQSNFTLTLDQLKRDANVMVLDSEGEMVFSGFNPSNAPEFVSGTLDAGDYTVQVFPVGAAKTNYFLKMNADPITGGESGPIDGGDDGGDGGDDPLTGDPNGTPATATDLGSDPLTQNDRVGFKEGGVDDVSDYYKFTVAATDDVQIVLGELKQNADLTLLDSNGVSTLATSANMGTRTEVIEATLDAGDYYLRVDAVGSAQTDYTVQFF
jgi:hypothetical protein